MQRKRLTIQSAIAGAFVTALCSFYTFAGINDGLLAYFPFDGSTNDATGKTICTNYGATLTSDRFQKSGKAVLLDGVNDYLRIKQTNALANLQNVTITCWVKYYKPISGANNVSVLICNGHEKLAEQGLFNYLGKDQIGFYLGKWGDAVVATVPFDATIPLANQDYAFICFIVTDDSLFFYKNNLQTSAAARNGKPIYRPSSDWYIGTSSHPYYPYYLNGAIDDIRIYDRAISISEINELYHENGAGDTNSVFLIPSSEQILIDQFTQKSQNVHLKNISPIQQTCSFEILNSNSKLKTTVPLEQILIKAGESYEVPISVDATEADTGVYNLLLKTNVIGFSPIFSKINVRVCNPQQHNLPDLSITSSDINLANYTINGPATLSISVHNNGTAVASNVPVKIYRFSNFVSITNISSIAIGATQTIQVTIPLVTSGEHLINVFIDSSQTIEELDKTNNEACKIIEIGGQAVQPGGILVTAALPKNVYTDALFNITGRTMYDVIVDGVRYTNYLVKGCVITLTISDNAGHSWVYNGGHSTTSGDYLKVVQAPSIVTGHFNFSHLWALQNQPPKYTLDFTPFVVF